MLDLVHGKTLHHSIRICNQRTYYEYNPEMIRRNLAQTFFVRTRMRALHYSAYTVSLCWMLDSCKAQSHNNGKKRKKETKAGGAMGDTLI